jgi:hypothetical protein
MTEKSKTLAFKIPGCPPEPFGSELRRLAAKWEEARIAELESSETPSDHQRLNPWLSLMEKVVRKAPDPVEAQLYCQRLLDDAILRVETPERLAHSWGRLKEENRRHRARPALRLIS